MTAKKYSQISYFQLWQQVPELLKKHKQPRTVSPLWTALVKPQGEHMTIEAYDWDIERCRAYAEQLRDKTRANTAEHAAQAIEWLLAQLASHQRIGKKREWVGLTDEEFDYLRDNNFGVSPLISAVEAKLKEKNNG
jgi:hypothetical protein